MKRENDCPILTCELLAKGCKGEPEYKNVTIDAETYVLSGLKNVRYGWENYVCIRCKNSEQTIETDIKVNALSICERNFKIVPAKDIAVGDIEEETLDYFKDHIDWRPKILSVKSLFEVNDYCPLKECSLLEWYENLDC